MASSKTVNTKSAKAVRQAADTGSVAELLAIQWEFITKLRLSMAYTGDSDIDERCRLTHALAGISAPYLKAHTTEELEPRLVYVEQMLEALRLSS